MRIVPFALAMALSATPLRAEEAAHRHVAVSGQGEIAVMPDRARVRMGVTQLGADLPATEAKVHAIVRAFLTEARALGLKDERVNTTGASIQPEYIWDEKERNNRLVGYRVSRDVEVLLTDLDRLGDLMLRATKAGMNQVQPPQLESSKAREIQQQALVQAAQDAQARAKLLAESLGAKLGAVHSINTLETGTEPPMPKMTMAMRSDASGGNELMGLNAGEIRYGASVAAQFELLGP